MEYPKITFTITTCRRLDLFMRTMESFMVNCLDIDLIDRWLLSDDGSSIEDVMKMTKLYPQFELISGKTSGQAASLNRLFGSVESEWFFHCEDDWTFTKKDNFIRKMFDVVYDDARIKNIVLRGWKGAYIKHGPLEYYMHVFNYGGDPAVAKVNDWTWFGYSLNPGLQHKPTVDLIGKNREDIKSRVWDKITAEKYMKLGYKKANLIEPYIEHIGGGRSVYGR